MPFRNYQKDANSLAKELSSLDLNPLDPPYNQHHHSSNYFILNLIANMRQIKFQKSQASQGLNRSVLIKSSAGKAFSVDIEFKSEIVLISFNKRLCKPDEFENLNKIGKFIYCAKSIIPRQRNLKLKHPVDELLRFEKSKFKDIRCASNFKVITPQIAQILQDTKL